MKGFIEVTVNGETVLVNLANIVYVEPNKEASVLWMLGKWPNGNPIVLHPEESFSVLQAKIEAAAK